MAIQNLFLYAECFILSGLWALLIPVIPLFALSLEATPLEFGLIGSVGSVVYVIITLSTGRLWLRVGMKKPIILSCVLYAATCFFYKFATLPTHIILLRILEGFSWGLFWPQIESLIAERASKSVEMVSNFGISWSLGNVFGALLSGIALEVYQPPKLFIVTSLLSLSLGFANLFLVQDTSHHEPETLDPKHGVDIPNVLRQLRLSWLVIILYAFSINIIFAYFPAYAEIRAVSRFVIGLCIFLLMAGRTLAFYLFKKIINHLDNFAIIGFFLISLSSIPFAYTIVPALLLASLSLGFGLGLIYLKAFHRAMTADPANRTLYSNFFEGFVGVGYMTSIIGGVFAEKYAAAPFFLSFTVTVLVFVSLSFKNFVRKTST